MDSNLVEKITRLVLLKLEEHSSVQEHSEILPLTEEELKRWKDISSSLGVTTNRKNSLPDGDQEIGQVKFSRFY